MKDVKTIWLALMILFVGLAHAQYSPPGGGGGGAPSGPAGGVLASTYPNPSFSYPASFTGRVIVSPDGGASAVPLPSDPNNNLFLAAPFTTADTQNNSLLIEGYMPTAGGNFGTSSVMRGSQTMAIGSNQAGHTTAATTIWGLVGGEHYTDTYGDNTVVTGQIVGQQIGTYSAKSNSPLADMIGQQNFVNLYDTGTVRNMFGSRTYVLPNAGGNASALYGHYINVSGTGGTVSGNAYGIYLENVSGAAGTNYAIKTGTGSVDFSGATNLRAPSDTTGTTQSANDNSTKMSTTAYADRAASNAAGTKSPPYLVSGSNYYGPLLSLTPPPASGWSWANQGSSTVSTVNSSLLFSFVHVGSTDNIRCYMRNLPASSNYTAEIAAITRAHAVGMAVSDGTKYIFIWDGGGGVLTGYEWNSTTSVGSGYMSNNSSWSMGGPLLWMRFVDDGTNRLFYTCGDGDTCLLVNSSPSHTFLTETEFGLCYETNQGSDGTAKLVHVASSTP